MPKSFFTIAVCAGLIWIGGISPWFGSHPPVGVAWADDGDDGGDDGDGDDDGDDGAGYGGGGGGNRGFGGVSGGGGGGVGLNRMIERLFQPRRAPPRQAPAPRPAPRPDFAPNEIVALDLTDDDLATLIGQGFAVLQEAAVPGLDVVSRRLSVPGDLTLAQARDAVRALPSGQEADFNHFYRSESGFDANCRGAECPARQMIDWPQASARAGTCGSSITIGMVDTGINDGHETFAGARLELRRLSPDDFDASRALHGTAVAALLVGDPATRSPGLVPGARLVAVDAFYRRGGDERADVFTLLQAIGFLADQGVQVLNLSLAGPDNTVLARVMDQLVTARDIVVVAAVGNAGPRADPEFPAAYEPVIAVTAVDRGGAIYRRAVRGPHVDIAAPGVNVWTAASISGARWKTGTSFAVPFVTAAAAILREARPDLTATEVADALRDAATDLGDPGLDEVFGAGLLNIAGVCGRQPLPVRQD